MLKTTDGNIIPGITILRDDGTRSSYFKYTASDVEIAKQNAANGGPGAMFGLDEIAAAKEMIALDALDGKIDFKCGSLELEPPRYPVFWSDNSAKRMLLALMEGTRTLIVNGRKVEVTPALKAWVENNQFLESVEPAPGNG